jgi:hypothetical protein
VRALARRFRGRFLHLARRALPGVAFPHIPWDKPWIVFAKPVIQGAERTLEYLGRYVHKTAISDHSIAGFDDHTVSFRYRDSRDQQRKTMTLPAHEFLRRFLQHVPRKGLHGVRAFGLLHPAHRDTLRRLQLLLAPRRSLESSIPTRPVRPRWPCSQCRQASLLLVRRLSPEGCLTWATSSAPASAGDPQARAPP